MQILSEAIDDSESSDEENESETQRKMKEAAKKIAKGARFYDLAMRAHAAINKE